MEKRLDYGQAAPASYHALLSLDKAVEHCGLEPLLLALVQMRASQINGCAYCLDMHSKDARALGETEQRLYLLDAWREAPFYTERERAALEWTEAITLISQTHAPDDVYERAAKQFNPEELANLTLAIATINSWNRLNVSFRVEAGSYQSTRQPAPEKAAS